MWQAAQLHSQALDDRLRLLVAAQEKERVAWRAQRAALDEQLRVSSSAHIQERDAWRNQNATLLMRLSEATETAAAERQRAAERERQHAQQLVLLEESSKPQPGPLESSLSRACLSPGKLWGVKAYQ